MIRSQLVSRVVSHLREDAAPSLQEWADRMIVDHNITMDELWNEQARQARTQQTHPDDTVKTPG